jgi:eukaryotic-like serine/threonine-protein kinase
VETASAMSQRFLEMIEKSGLLDKEQVDAFLDQLRKEGHAEVLDNEQALSEKFVAAGHLTQWQTEKLLQGKHKGFLLGNYKLLRHLGSGGMSTVFLAEHKHMRQRRAIKVLPQNRVNDSSYLGRFYREARAAAALDHPNIVRAYDVDSDGDNHYLVMEFVEGTDIQKLVAMQGVLPYETAVEYIRQSAFGLAHAHQVGLIHRDIKPANLLVDTKGTVKILDMGLARFADDEKQASLTQMHDENVLGTADYLAPEQAINSHTVDARADLYSLGCTLYFALTGHPPFPEGSLAQRLLMHQQREPAPIAKDRPDVPKDLVAICKRMMAKSLDERFQNAEQVEQALSRWQSDRGGNRGGAFQSSGSRNTGGSPAGGGGGAGGGARPGVQTAQRVLQKAKPAEDSNNPPPGVGDTLTGSGQPTTKGPAGGKSDGGSSSKLGNKKPGESGSSPIIGPPPTKSNKKPGDSSGNYNFNIKTDDSNVLSNKSGKKPVAAKAAGDSGSSSGSGPKASQPTKAAQPAAPAKTQPAAKKPVAAAPAKPAGDSGKGKQGGDEAPAKIKPLRRKTSAKKVMAWGIVMFLICCGLLYGVYFAIQYSKAEAERRTKEWKEAEQKVREAKERGDAPAQEPAPGAPVATPQSTTLGVSEVQIGLPKPGAPPIAPAPTTGT